MLGGHSGERLGGKIESALTFKGFARKVDVILAQLGRIDMTYRVWTALALTAALAACGGNPFVETPVDPGPVDPEPTVDPVPASVSKDLKAISYDPANGGTLRVDMTGVTSSAQMAQFQRIPSMDIASAGNGQPNYRAFVYQETELTRSYLAYVATNARGNLIAVSATDGGQFNEHNAGGRFARMDVYKRPTIGEGPEEGVFSYAGTYAGMFVPGEWDNPANPRPPGLRPAVPWRVTGDVQINGSFSPTDANGAATRPELIEGGIVNRALFDSAGNQITAIQLGTQVVDTATLADLTLRETAIDSNGQFLGNVEFYGKPGQDIGDYAGLFAADGTDVAGVLWLHPIEGQNGVWEYGTFNLPRCDLAGSAPLCVPR